MLFDRYIKVNLAGKYSTSPLVEDRARWCGTTKPNTFLGHSVMFVRYHSGKELPGTVMIEGGIDLKYAADKYGRLLGRYKYIS